MRLSVGTFAVALGLAVSAVLGTAAFAEKRLALAVGIDVYDQLPATAQLEKAVSDARWAPPSPSSASRPPPGRM